MKPGFLLLMGVIFLVASEASISSATREAEMAESGDVAQTPAASCPTGRAVIRGRITRAGGLRGVPGISITIDGPEDCGNITTTRALGVFVFSALGPGAYTLTPRQDGCTFTPPSRDLVLVGPTVRVQFVMTCP